VFTQKAVFGSAKVASALLALAFVTPAVAAPTRLAPAAPRHPSVWTAPTPPRNIQFQALPLERSRQNHLLVRAFINGKPALLGVDSGAPVSAIALDRVHHFGVKAAGANAGVPTRLQINGRYSGVMVAKSLRLGSLNLVDEPLVAIDLSGSSKAAKMTDEQAIDGILGADILFPTHAVLDCQAQVLILKVDPDAQGGFPGMDYRGFSGIPIQVTPGDNLYVDGTVNGKRAKLMIDTGAFGTLLHQRFVRRMKIPLRDTPYSSAGVNLKQRGVQLATISRMSIGSVQMRSKEVGVIDLQGLIRNALLDATPPVAGLLGSEILRRYHAIIDFGTNTLYLKN
jgi:predicted aspartyl protease